jgi:hypothetical protein
MNCNALNFILSLLLLLTKVVFMNCGFFIQYGIIDGPKCCLSYTPHLIPSSFTYGQSRNITCFLKIKYSCILLQVICLELKSNSYVGKILALKDYSKSITTSQQICCFPKTEHKCKFQESFS